MNWAVRLKTIATSVLAIIIFALVIGFLSSKNFTTPRHFPLVQLDDGWTVSRGENIYNPEVLSECNIGVADKNSVTVMTRILPDYALSPATIHYRTILSTTDVYLDDELIYSWGQDYVDSGRMLPKFQHFITLPDDNAGKTIKIVITAQENNAFSGISPVTIGNEEEISRALVQKSRLPLVVGVFLIVFGILLLVTSPYLVFTENHDYSILFSGIISMLMGTYILCYYDLFWLFSDQPSFYTYIEYFSLFSIPAAILGFLTFAHQIHNYYLRIVLWVVNVGFSLVTSLLHVLNIVHICHFVEGLHLIAVIEGVYIIISLSSLVKNSRKRSSSATNNITSTTMLILGLFLLVICSVIDIIKFNIMKFISVGEVNTNINFMTVGALLFVICLVLNYFFHCIEYISESSLEKHLEGLAYTDSLSGIYNRSKCELVLAGLTGDFTIISIDLDYLKYTNDNYGHAFGDKLLSGFASILRNSFTDATLIGRMGGDEFIIILPYIDESRVKRDIAAFEDLMAYKSTIDAPIKYSASYGYADSNDPQITSAPNAQTVYLLADTRMYQMKSKHHQSTLGRLYEDLLNSSPEKGGSNND